MSDSRVTPRLFAISDLHLSLGVDKPMDIFGPQWIGHDEKIRTAWDSRIGPDDWVLVGGDTSWGLNLEQARPDLDWLGERPGRKILIKGNHCTWWTSRKKVEAVLDPSITLLQNDAVQIGEGEDAIVVIGARLWDPPDAPWADEKAGKVYHREIERLRLSIAAGAKLEGRTRIALIHYPPRYADGRVTDAVPMIEAAGVSICIYGHLHGDGHKFGFVGEAGGIRYYLTACDAIDFAPIEIPLGAVPDRPDVSSAP